MKTFEIVTKKTVTQEQVENILTDAFEGGVMTDWCEGVVIVKEPEEQYDYASEVLTRGGELSIVDGQEYIPETDSYGKAYTLTLDMVLKALGESKIDFEDYDAVDADQVIQIALFGEVVYG